MDNFPKSPSASNSSAVKDEPGEYTMGDFAKLAEVKTEKYADDFEIVNDEDEPEYINLNAIHSSQSSGLRRTSSPNLYLNPLAASNNEAQSADDGYSQDYNEYLSDFDQSDGNNCKVCKNSFSDRGELLNHFKSRRLGERKYKCCNCEKVFRDNTQLNVHSRKHTGEQPFECKICSKKFSVNGNLNKHMRIHTGERRFECDVCDRKFTQFAHLEDHRRTHSGDRPYVCESCQAAFKTQARLKKHRKSHEDTTMTKRSVKCPRCNKTLRNLKQLAGHMSTHDNSGVPFSCIACTETFEKYHMLQIHQKIHSDMRNFSCNYCDTTFNNASHLRRHVISHSGVRPYTCEICNRAFPSQQNMKRHIMTHTGEKPFSCDICKKGFLTLENLNRHKRTHTGEKPFSCDICGRKFAHSTTAKEHQRIHTGEKPFSCTVCSKSFALSKILFKHVREKHPKFFPEFKKINSLPLNMKRALTKLQKEQNGEVNTERVFTQTVSIKSENSEDSKEGILDKTKVKLEKVDKEIEEKHENDFEVHMKSEEPVNNFTDITFIKVEKAEFSEDDES